MREKRVIYKFLNFLLIPERPFKTMVMDLAAISDFKQKLIIFIFSNLFAFCSCYMISSFESDYPYDLTETGLIWLIGMIIMCRFSYLLFSNHKINYPHRDFREER